jgi:glutamyl-Q tRNA(Asp) synthetase
VIDDALQGITDVMRGQDLFGSTAVHRLLQKILDLPQPVYNHHDLIRDGDGKKLSKSSEAIGLGELRTRGMTPGEVRSSVGLP